MYIARHIAFSNLKTEWLDGAHDNKKAINIIKCWHVQYFQHILAPLESYRELQSYVGFHDRFFELLHIWP